MSAQWNWDEKFGKEYYIEIKNEERKYFGLEEMCPEWDAITFYSKTNAWYKRVVVFLNLDAIVKVIKEEKGVSPDGIIRCHTYMEYDTNLKTEDREWILPLTSRGKKKKLTPTNILNVTPFGCTFNYSFTVHNRQAQVWVYNSRNNKQLAIGEEERINKIRNPEDFRIFMEEYVKTCPENYWERIERLKNSEHVTVKYRVGDVFRIEMDRFHYAYGIITGDVKKIKQRNILPERHSLNNLMMVPIMVRYYDVLTTNESMTIEELKDVPLSRVSICGDNDIIWGTHQIIGNKKLEENDLEFNLVCQIFTRNDPGLHIEWGTAVAKLSENQLSDKFKEYFKNYHSPHNGVCMGIYPEFLTESEEARKRNFNCKYNLLEPHNDEIRGELFMNLGLAENATFDDFARKFGGLTKHEILNLL